MHPNSGVHRQAAFTVGHDRRAVLALGQGQYDGDIEAEIKSKPNSQYTCQESKALLAVELRSS